MSTKIYSIDGKSFIDLARNYGNDWTSFQIEARIDIGHAQFSGKNCDLCLLNLPEFIAGLDQFILDRTVRPRLEGTYDTCLTFTASGRRIRMEFTVGSYCIAPQKLTGSFEVLEESLFPLLSALHTLSDET